MAKKDFSTNANVRAAIAEATGEAPADTQEVKPKRKPRKTYSKQEAQELLQTMDTSGRKGLKLPRINLAFAPDVYEYCRTMSCVRGQNMTEFINYCMRQNMEQHMDIYKKALEFRDSF